MHHSFSYTVLSFDKCIQSRNHCHSQDREQFSYLDKFPHVSLCHSDLFLIFTCLILNGKYFYPHQLFTIRHHHHSSNHGNNATGRHQEPAVCQALLFGLNGLSSHLIFQAVSPAACRGSWPGSPGPKRWDEAMREPRDQALGSVLHTLPSPYTTLPHTPLFHPHTSSAFIPILRKRKPRLRKVK